MLLHACALMAFWAVGFVSGLYVRGADKDKGKGKGDDERKR